jgi:hypothetical protein
MDDIGLRVVVHEITGLADEAIRMSGPLSKNLKSSPKNDAVGCLRTLS